MRALTRLERCVQFMTNDIENIYDTKATIKDRTYTIFISLQDIDKMQEYNKKIQENNHKVDKKQGVYLYSIVFLEFCMTAIVFASIFVLDKPAFKLFIFLGLITFLLILLFVFLFRRTHDMFEYFIGEDMFYAAEELREFLDKSDLSEGLVIDSNNLGNLLISAIEKDTKVFKQYKSCSVYINYHKKNYISIESFAIKKSKMGYYFKVLLPLEVGN